MAFPKQFIQEVKDRILVSDVVGRRVRLQRRGNEYVGLSPFKVEKTPSFTVNDQKQFYHCFATGKHGSIFDFLMEVEGLHFPEAVERLATEAGMTLPERDPHAAERSAKRAGLTEIMTKAATWFRAQLDEPQAQEARDYLKQRGVSDALIDAFGVGFAPSGRGAGSRGLAQHLAAQNITPAQMAEAGLAIQPDDNGRNNAPFDRFRDRIIFPIADRRGQVIAFGGRAMQADAPAKYLNSPETPLFHKGATLYNFHRARQSAHEQSQIIVVEGYMDVVGLARGGIDNAVASLGTAVTEGQITQLWQLAPEPILCLDGDEAGLRAAYRVIDRVLPLLKAGFSLRFAKLPAGFDPDDIISKQGAQAMRDIISNATNLLDMLWERELMNNPLGTPERSAALKKKLRAYVATIGDKDVRTLYGQEIATRLDNFLGAGASSTGKILKMGGGQYQPRHAYGSPPASRTLAQSPLVRRIDDIPLRQQHIVLCVLTHPALLIEHRDLFEALALPRPLNDLRFEIIDFFDSFTPSDDLGDTMSGLDKTALSGHLKARGLEETLERLENLLSAQRFAWRQADTHLDEVAADWLEIVGMHHKLKALEGTKAEIEKELEGVTERGDAEAEQGIIRRLTKIKGEMAALEQAK